MSKPYLPEATFQRRAARFGREAENRDAKRLDEIGKRIEAQRAKRLTGQTKPTENGIPR